ncbi:MAG: UTP--glucose-1-phosphate uridylyltransferase GalU [Kiritimatiellia bacterium]|jgi:UTP--glucose-1-phosphate uridylyltransferase|nr:UTP--glucose-1-phosphate uridylyltransferase GalU [Kiritimatiellia bacterium]MDP6848585.1 UTP--glucose-1-phosphate uridylyltransferase GalU [Kiritimatiellia bacterium]
MIRKAVIPAAGFGTRFLPASKSQPKEMLPIVDTPVIQYVVEEAVASGITDILMVIGKGKRAVEEHFDRNFELEAELREKGKQAELDAIKRISDLADIHFIWQKELRGLGDAVACARHHVGGEPFAVLLGDTLVESGEPVTKQLLGAFERYQESVVALEEVPMEKVSRYGVIDGQEISDDIFLIRDFVEKPEVNDAPSNLAIAGRYILTPGIFEEIEKTVPGKNDEIQLTDAMRSLVSSRAIYGLRFSGRRFDVGNKLDFIKTNVTMALKRPDLREDVESYILELAESLK